MRLFFPLRETARAPVSRSVRPRRWRNSTVLKLRWAVIGIPATALVLAVLGYFALRENGWLRTPASKQQTAVPTTPRSASGAPPQREIPPNPPAPRRPDAVRTPAVPPTHQALGKEALDQVGRARLLELAQDERIAPIDLHQMFGDAYHSDIIDHEIILSLLNRKVLWNYLNLAELIRNIETIVKGNRCSPPEKGLEIAKALAKHPEFEREAMRSDRKSLDDSLKKHGYSIEALSTR